MIFLEIFFLYKISVVIDWMKIVNCSVAAEPSYKVWGTEWTES